MDKYFKDNQKLLLEIINSKTGRSQLDIKHGFPIFKITPNSYHYLIDFENKKPLCQAVFFEGDVVAYRLMEFLKGEIMYDPLLRKMVTTQDIYNHFWNPLHFRFNSSTFNPDAGERAGRTNNKATWAGARGATTSDTDMANAELSSQLNGGTYYNYRLFEPFNTSSLGAGATVTASNYQGYRDDTQEAGGNGFNNADTTTAEIVPSGQASGSSYASSDYGSNIVFTSKGSLAFASTSNNAYNTITITDQTQISVTGETKLALITGRDLNNNAPTGLNTLSFQNKSQTNPPVLTVTYTPAPGGGGFWAFM